MKRLLQLIVIAGLVGMTAMPAGAQAGPLTTRFTGLLRSLENGHTPSREEITSAADQPQPDKEDMQAALPLMLKALDSTDKDIRAYTLFVLDGLEVTPAKPADTPAGAVGKKVADTPSISIYKGYVATELVPAIPKIAAHLTEDDEVNRQTTVNILQGFGPNPPATVVGPLLDFLKRDDSISLTGEEVVGALLTFGVPGQGVAEGIATYLGRSDQTTRSRSDLIDAIGLAPYQSQVVNRALLGYLDSDDATVRARLILSLPQLDLSPEVFADVRAKVSLLAANESENLQVINAAKAVSGCWTGPRMATACPVY